jgi:RHS repeat-associated protein
MCLARWLGQALLLLPLVPISFAQVATGNQPLGSFSAGPDVINLGNLNVHLDAPVFSKPGRGLPFNYVLSFDNSVWYPATSAWIPVANWGWRGPSDAVTGLVPAKATTHHCIDPDTGFTVFYTITIYGPFTDGFGVIHPVYSTVVEDSICGPGSTTPGTATDGSGYTLTGRIVTSRSGQEISPIGSVGYGSGTITDANGNQVVANNGTFTDTLGMTALSVSGTAPNPEIFTYTDSSNTQRSVTVNYSTYTVMTAFGCSGIAEYGPTSVSLISSISYPDGSSYSFTYEPTPGASGDITGRIQSITLRTGGKISYTYTGGSNGIVCADGSTAGLTRTTSDGTTTYTRSGSGSVWTTTIKDAMQPTNDQTSINFQTTGSPAMFMETHRTINQGTSTLLMQTDTCYNAATVPCSSTAINLPISQIDSYATFNDNHESRTTTFLNDVGLTTEVDEYNFGSGTAGTLLRKTLTTYASLGNNILDHPASIVVQDGSGNQKAATTFNYDETTPTATTGVPAHTSISGSRGNLTTFGQWNSVTNAYLNTAATYDDTGNVLTSTDPKGNQTQFSYQDNFGDGVNRSSLAYVTQTTLPATNSVQHITKTKYDANTGLPITTWDQNNNQTTYTYDLLLRPLQTTFPDQGQTVFTYPDANTVTKAVKLNSTASDTTTLKFDGLGRQSQAQHATPSGTALIDTTYDALGRPASISNPYFSTTDPTYAVITTSYDALNRITKITDQDGNAGTVDYTQPTCPVVADEAGKKSKACSDALSRLTSMFEDPAGANYETDYQYDVLNNLIRVDQKGSAPTDSTQWRTRTFTYDSLSRMLTASNPESGTITYTYDGNGNALTRVSPAPNQTGSATVTTSYVYDALNRVTQTSYSDGKTATVNYLYDAATGWSNPTVTQSNLIGRLSEIYTNTTNITGEQVFSYDSMGRVVVNNQCTPSNCGSGNYPVSAAYDLAGNLASLTYPSGRVVNYGYNSASWLDQVQFASWNGSAPSGGAYNYWSAADNNFYAAGVPKSWNTGNGITETLVLNNRLQVQEQKVNNSSIATFADHVYGYGTQNNGNINSIADQLNSSRTQSFGYDAFNRLSSATESRWGLSFGYDAWHNRLQQNVTSGSAGGIQITVDGNNHIQGAPSNCTIANRYCYDSAGNLLHDNLDHQYAYDAENRVTQVDNGAANYTYALDGNRVRKNVTGSDSTEYVYFGGVAIAERDATTGYWSDYIFGNGRRIARAQAVDNTLHIYGNRCSSCGTQYSLFYLQNAGGLGNYTIRSGDKLALTQYQPTGSHGGMVIAFTDGTNTNWNLKDQDGYYANDDGTQNTTHVRKMDLSAFAGKTVQQLAMNQENDTAGGSFFITYKQVSLTSADGLVQPIYTGQPSSPVSSIVATSGVTGTGSQIDVNQNKAIYPNDTTIYYHGNQLDSSALITGGNGWPVWQATYLPYGEEYNPEVGDSHYKFAALERDSETSLDHTWFRQYGGTLGRWLTSDPYLGSIIIDDPKSLNRYAYVEESPENFADHSGLFIQTDPEWPLLVTCTLFNFQCPQGGVSGIATDGGGGGGASSPASSQPPKSPARQQCEARAQQKYQNALKNEVPLSTLKAATVGMWTPMLIEFGAGCLKGALIGIEAGPVGILGGCGAGGLIGVGTHAGVILASTAISAAADNVLSRVDAKRALQQDLAECRKIR